MKKIKPIKVEKKTLMEKFNPYQSGHGVHVSEKNKGRKSKRGQRERNALREYY